MGRALVVLAFLWVVALAGFLALRRTPKTSPLWGLRDFFWLLLQALSVVSLLVIVALATGLITLQWNPFTPAN
ncbi:hypothetical protein [Meiothermus taiwanensis]|uniref:Uncharacterized protein n=2 Tax=Meiothermus taiwanensis TaxID=172827 RepID=A0A399E6M3_9DEIN|nr:hypothetical protein [Meiothermus taiwanensis]AWR85515.1 hypothetical protein Mtai_v1c02640 [Meiothermus taiwanensis WR-220]KIQ55669.1 hypothetical protein SY28_02450 [Meiothermus taiwanensis]KZK16418.1 hypothetical protein A3962_00325 [Meiothermus taiwanensis]RIH80115.1 hypothetical protein Mcate_00086 [Meiothermus taiwanensis]